MIGSRSIIASSGISRAGAASSIVVRRLPSAVSEPVALAQLAEILLQPRAAGAHRCPAAGLQAGSFPSPAPSRSLRSSISSSWRERAQAHVEDRLGLAVGQVELGDHHRLGLVLGADDLDHPVEVEERDDVAVEQLHPVGDLRQPVRGAALEHDELVIDPAEQRLAQAHHPRRAARIEHVEVQADAIFQIAHPEQAFHQQGRVDRAAARLDDDADLGIGSRRARPPGSAASCR